MDRKEGSGKERKREEQVECVQPLHLYKYFDNPKQ